MQGGGEETNQSFFFSISPDLLINMERSAEGQVTASSGGFGEVTKTFIATDCIR